MLRKVASKNGVLGSQLQSGKLLGKLLGKVLGKMLGKLLRKVLGKWFRGQNYLRKTVIGRNVAFMMG